MYTRTDLNLERDYETGFGIVIVSMFRGHYGPVSNRLGQINCYLESSFTYFT
jgi:hypothetical protein